MLPLNLNQPLKKAFTIGMLLFPFYLGIFAQHTIKGKIFDVEENIALPQISIRIMGNAEGVLSDSTGAFHLQTSMPLPLKLAFSHLGYYSQQIEVSNPSQTLVVYLEKSIMTMDQVVVTASRRKEKVTDAPASISIIDARHLQNDVVSHPIFSLRNVPGVEIQEQGIGAFQTTLRGRQNPFGVEALVLVDNRQLVLPGFIHVPFGLSGIESIDLERVEVVRGPGSALYGPGVEGGVVHFLTKDPFRYAGTTIKAYGGERASVGGAIRHAQKLNDKWGYKVLATYKRANNWPLSAEDSLNLGPLPSQVISSLSGQVLDINSDINEVESMNFSGSLYFRPKATTQLVATAGYGQFSGRNMGATSFLKFSDLPTVFGQLRLQTGNFFGQIYARNVPGKERVFNYSDGLSDYSDGTQVEIQGQYNWDQLDQQKLDITIGFDYEGTFLDTKETFHGKYEDDDAYQVMGGYTQVSYKPSTRLEFLAAGRADYFYAQEQTTFSPRLGFVYKPTVGHQLRLTYNQSYGFLGASEIFMDLRNSPPAPFYVNVWGFFSPITYTGTPQMRSYFGLGRSAQLGIPLPAAYGITLNRLSNSLPTDVINYLSSLSGEIVGFSNGIMKLEGREVTELFSRKSAGQLPLTNQFELGYKGLIGTKLLWSLDVYYNERKNLFSLQTITPVVNTPNLGNDLERELLRVLDANQIPQSFTKEEIASLFKDTGNGLGNSPIGIGVMEPDQLIEQDKPGRLLAFVNFGKISYWGTEASIKYAFTPEFSAFTNYSWLSNHYFDDEALNEKGTNLEYSLNLPEHRFRLGFDYLPSKGFHANLAFRYGTAFEVRGGGYNGHIPEVAVLDAGIGYTFDFGLKADITATNLFNRKYRTLPPLPEIGRMVLGQLIYEF